MSSPRIGFVASGAPSAQQACAEMAERYPNVPPEEADVIVALGGDGFMLETLHQFLGQGVAIFGMHRGTVGFLMNHFDMEGLEERLAAANPVELTPLRMKSRCYARPARLRTFAFPWMGSSASTS